MSNSTNSNQGSFWVSNTVFVILIHAFACIILFTVTPMIQTILMTLILWILAGIGTIIVFIHLGITMGYHRLWSHKSFKAALPLRFVLSILGTIGFQGSIKWWVLRHRLHHRFTDTEDDPYNALRGFWFSHIGWIFERHRYEKGKYVDLTDIEHDEIVVLQHKFYIPMAIFLCFLIPTLVAQLWNDAIGGFLYGGIICRLLIWHTTFSINSIAHWFGSQDYTINVSARGNYIAALLTSGEGYHNFHHAFPSDYRNGIHFADYDPTKWLINLASILGLAKDLKSTSIEEIKMNFISTMEKKTHLLMAEYDWGKDQDSLPIWSEQDILNHIKSNESILLIIEDYVVNVTDYASSHPGGNKILKSYNGKNVTNTFFRGPNIHSNAAIIKMKKFRIAKVK